ncbi:MAG: 16S rRNA (guanine(527)-N(7))-methyltransferase RsmG, partial [Ruthenibacterium lactatiformans]
MIDTERLIRKAAAYGIDAAPVVRKLDEYAALLVEYNQKVNLTAITDAEGIEDRHFIDSLLLAARPEVCGRMVDVGTGAGFPGIVAKLFRPELDLTLMEPTGTRVDFLKYACSALGVEAEFAKERAEEAARKQWRESFDVATARAVAALPVLAEYCLPLLRRGGVFIAMKGSGADEEIDAAQGAVAKLGGTYE